MATAFFRSTRTNNFLPQGKATIMQITPMHGDWVMRRTITAGQANAYRATAAEIFNIAAPILAETPQE
jgi:hypothetical protein